MQFNRGIRGKQNNLFCLARMIRVGGAANISKVTAVQKGMRNPPKITRQTLSFTTVDLRMSILTTIKKYRE